MKINYYEDIRYKEPRVDVYYSHADEEVRNLMSFLEKDQIIVGTMEHQLKHIFLNQIYYLEIVDRRCFAYLEKEVYQISYNLKEFADTYGINGFVQTGKSTVVNINHIDRIVPDLNMRMHLLMNNGERLVLNRAYKKSFINYLKKARKEKK